MNQKDVYRGNVPYPHNVADYGSRRTSTNKKHKIIDVPLLPLSKIESQEEMQIGALSRIIQALGGELELVAHLPRGNVRLSQFRQRDRSPAE